jgi:hypothetical protein
LPVVQNLFSCPTFVGYGTAGSRITVEMAGGHMRPIAALVLLALAGLPLPASAWNNPAHMLSAAITYQVLRQENPKIIEKVKAALEKHP